MAIRYSQDKNGYLVYTNTQTGASVRVWDGDLVDAIDICEQWHGGQSSPCYRMLSEDFSYRTLRGALDELRYAQQIADKSGMRIDGDDYLDLLTTIERVLSSE